MLLNVRTLPEVVEPEIDADPPVGAAKAYEAAPDDGPYALYVPALELPPIVVLPKLSIEDLI